MLGCGIFASQSNELKVVIFNPATTESKVARKGSKQYKYDYLNKLPNEEL